MTTLQKIFLLVIFAALLLPACGSATLTTLGVADKPTLVFIYTDG